MEKMKGIIKCPHCGYEYIPEEIFIPSECFGKSSNILRNSEGKIEYHEGLGGEFEDDYICDNCNKPFVVKGKMTFEVKAIEEFSEEESISIYDNERISLEEPNKA